MKFMTMLLVVAVAMAALSTFTNGEKGRPGQSNEDGSSSSSSEGSGLPSCSSLKTYNIDYNVFLKLYPLTVFQSTSPAFNCTKLVYLSPADEDDDYSGTVIGLRMQSGTYFAIDATYTNSINATWCGSGLNLPYPIVYAKFNHVVNAYCVVLCHPDGVQYLSAICAGLKPSDKVETQNFIDETFKGGLPFLDMEEGCPKPQHCYTFNY